MTELYGHGEKLAAFGKLIEDGALSHAYLFYGRPGVGKFYFAKILAERMEFGAVPPKKEPFLDTFFVEPDEKGVIGVEAVREMRKFLSQRPFRSVRRLAVVRDAEALTREAESAMLKMVEEPGETAMIVFVASDPQVLFAPLRSRLVKIYFPSFGRSEIESILAKRYKISAREAKLVASKSFGRLGLALRLVKGRKRKTADLVEEITEEILRRYFKGVRTESGKISQLLERATAAARFNLNANLQRKALQYLIEG